MKGIGAIIQEPVRFEDGREFLVRSTSPGVWDVFPAGSSDRLGTVDTSKNRHARQGWVARTTAGVKVGEASSRKQAVGKLAEFVEELAG